MSDLSHVNQRGEVHMVDVSQRPITVRTAVATGLVRSAATGSIAAGTVAKGDVLAAARIAGIMAAKHTWELVPMCHPIALHSIAVDLAPDPEAGVVRVAAQVRTADRTGVEMEALTAVSVACLTIIDMTKSLDPAASIENVWVESKTGGASGDWTR
jgi:cyclic pyranopterin monophosphate synthase